MPFTPFHLSPALAVGLPLRKYIHALTFIVADIVVDIEPFLVLLCNINYSLYGYAHTFIGALLIVLTLSYTMYIFKNSLNNIFRTSKLVIQEQKFTSYAVAGVSGTFLHVLLNSPLYSDIKPLYPLNINPLFNPEITLDIYTACTLLLLAGLVIYLIILFRR
ncbi:MAG: hydrolase [Thermoprotei archaeon]